MADTRKQLDKIVDIGGAKPKATILDELEALIAAKQTEGVRQKLKYLNHFDRTIAANGSCELFEALDAALSKEAQT
jgi:hypothetical protein